MFCFEKRTFTVFTFWHPRNKMCGNTANPQTVLFLFITWAAAVKRTFDSNFLEALTLHIKDREDDMCKPPCACKLPILSTLTTSKSQ